MVHEREEGEVARLSIIARLEYLPAAMSLVRDIAQRLGLTGQYTDRLELVAEEACLNVIEHAYEQEEEGSLDLVISYRPGQVVVAVEDRGMPFDFRKLADGQQSGLGTALMKAFADEINFLNLGRHGKRVELVKNLPRRELEEYAAAAKKAPHAEAEPVPEDSPVTLRLLNPEESSELARCIYRCYGYTYMENVYYPEQVKEMLEAGLMTSFAAFNEEGHVVGHTAITREHPRSTVGDYGKAVVDPRYRNHRLGTRLTWLALEYAKKAGMHGLFSEAAAVHPYSQQALARLGWPETGVLLGFVPETFYFKKIREKKEQVRTSVVIMYGVVNQGPERDIYLPTHHLSLLSRIYQRLPLKRNIITRSDTSLTPKLPPSSRLDVRTYTGESWAFMRVVEYGADLVELVDFRLKELCLRHIDCIYLDLPLTHPATRQFCPPLEMLGFFFGAVIPELADGDVLRLQYLNNVEIQTADIKTASDTGRQMVDYVLKLHR